MRHASLTRAGETKTRDMEKPEENQQQSGSGLESSPCSLADCPYGKMMAKLPHFREDPLPVEVDHWTGLDGSIKEKTVRLTRGLASHRLLTDAELAGAEFYPENAQSLPPADTTKKL